MLKGHEREERSPSACNLHLHPHALENQQQRIAVEHSIEHLRTNVHMDGALAKSTTTWIVELTGDGWCGVVRRETVREDEGREQEPISQI